MPPAFESRRGNIAPPQALNVTFEVDTEVTDDTVARALDRTIRAHPVLASGTDTATPTVEPLDLRDIAPQARRATAFEAAEAFCRTSFDGPGPRVRAQHAWLGTSSLVALAIDPRACDAWSANIIADEVSEFLDAHLDGAEPGSLVPDDGPGLLVHRAELERGAQGQDARRLAQERTSGLSPFWWPELTPDDTGNGAASQSRLRDLDDTVAAALTTRCRAARASVFPLALLSLQLLQSDPVTPRAVISTFAARESEQDYVAVGHFAVDVLVPVAIRGLTLGEALTAIRDDVFDLLGSPPVDWRECMPTPGNDDPLTVSVLYLPAQLSGGSISGSSHVTRASVSVCPTGADLDLFVIESPPVDDQGRTPLLRLGGTLNRAVPGFDLSVTLGAWAASMSELATIDTPWNDLPWPELVTWTDEGERP